MTLELRTVHVFKDNKWIEVPFHTLKRDDFYTLTDPDGTPVVDTDESGKTTRVNKATGDVFPDPDLPGNYGIQTEPVWDFSGELPE
jgi:hypothetical protein